MPQVIAIESKSTHPSALELATVLFALSAVALISFFSGYQSFEVPPDLAWQFSPLGFLQGISPENLELKSEVFFQGKWGFTPDYAIVFLKTCLYELPLYSVCFRERSRVSTLSILSLGNLLTHPAVFFIIPLFFERYVSAALTSEVFAPAVEMAFAYIVLTRTEPRMPPARAALRTLWILGANLMSWEIGSFL